MNPKLNAVLTEARIQEGLIDARLSTVESVIADFFRLVLSAKDDPKEDIVEGLEKMSKKLLRQQEVLLATKARASQRLSDLMKGVTEMMAKQEQAETE